MPAADGPSRPDWRAEHARRSGDADASQEPSMPAADARRGPACSRVYHITFQQCGQRSRVYNIHRP
jgi:hypothetical protein